MLKLQDFGNGLSRLKQYINKNMPWTATALRRSEKKLTQSIDRQVSREIVKSDFNSAASGQNTPAAKANQARERLEKAKQKNPKSRVVAPVSNLAANNQTKHESAKNNISTAASKPKQKTASPSIKMPPKGKSL